MSYEIKNISYVLKIPLVNNGKNQIVHFFEGKDCLQARDKAVNLAIQQRDKLKSYRGIQLTICFLEKISDKKFKKKRFNILTGWRMGSKKILTHLNIEYSILQNADVIFPKMVVDFEDENYLSVNQHFNNLYYFTFQ